MPIGNSQQTVIDSYQLVHEGVGADTVPTAFPIGVKTGDMDLLTPVHGGKGEETKANYLEVIFTGKPAGTGTIVITGACEGGPEEVIASLALTVGAVVETGDWRWVDTITLTSFHLAGCSIAVADSGNSRPAKFAFDAIGYRYIKFYNTGLATTTNTRTYARYF